MSPLSPPGSLLTSNSLPKSSSSSKSEANSLLSFLAATGTTEATRE